jgi:UDP-2,3-diacylglucosamine hydrolase
VNRLFVSDLHLEKPESLQFQAFSRLLGRESRRVDEIFLLGDLCEVWVGDDDDSPLARGLIEILAAASARTRLYAMVGNRDFLFGKGFETNTGCRLLPDPFRLDNGILLSHGDAFCTDDTDYQQLRAVLRSPAWQQDVLGRPLQERREMAATMRAQSKATNANKPENIMDVSAAELSRTMAEFQATVLIHGHTHRPGIHLHPWGRRYVLGSWERCGWAIKEDSSGDLSLRCFPLASRCEI